MAVSLTIDVGGYDYGFDFEDQRIDIDSALTTIVVGNVYDAIKSAQDDEVGIVYPKIADTEGLTALGGGAYTYQTVILLDDWKINSLKTSGIVTIGGGNLVRADEGYIIEENPLITYMNQTSQAGILFETGTSGLTAGESAKLDEIASSTITMTPQIDDLHKITGLDVSNPMTVTQTTRVAGAIELTITGDGTTTTTVTREP